VSLHEKFREQFVATATERFQTITRALEGPQSNAMLDGVASELHTLGGEASLLGALDIADLARHGEEAARERRRADLRAVLDQLEVAIFAQDLARSGT
jgi:HPt (histidine-containing phosphotransfer) domain-containing protein